MHTSKCEHDQAILLMPASSRQRALRPRLPYCAEQFENDGSPVSTIVKDVKRAMAGEYSRELSTKVSAGQCRLVELGFRQGGAAGFGLRRMLVDQSGVVKTELQRGEQKSLQTDRVILTPGPGDQVKTVQKIYEWFTDEGLVELEIARRLNMMHTRTDLDREWTRATVHQVLINEKYIGSNVYNRISFKLKKLRVVNTPDMWIRKDDAFEPIVTRDIFYTAQGIIRARAWRYSNDELIERLLGLYRHRGFLFGLVIDEAEGMPSSAVYAHRLEMVTARKCSSPESARTRIEASARNRSIGWSGRCAVCRTSTG